MIGEGLFITRKRIRKSNKNVTINYNNDDKNDVLHSKL